MKLNDYQQHIFKIGTLSRIKDVAAEPLRGFDFFERLDEIKKLIEAAEEMLKSEGE